MAKTPITSEQINYDATTTLKAKIDSIPSPATVSTPLNTPPLVSGNLLDLKSTVAVTGVENKLVCYDTINKKINLDIPFGSNVLVGIARQDANVTYASCALFIGGGATAKNYPVLYASDGYIPSVGEDIYIKNGICADPTDVHAWSLGFKVTEVLTATTQVAFQTSVDLCNFAVLKTFQYT